MARLFIHIVDYLFAFYDWKIHVSLMHYKKDSSFIVNYSYDILGKKNVKNDAKDKRKEKDCYYGTFLGISCDTLCLVAIN